MKNLSFSIAVVAVLLTAPMFTSADQNEVKRAPYQEHIDTKSIPYVDQLMINVMPGYEPAGGKPLSAALIRKISELAGVRITYVRNSDGIHLFQLPREIYGPNAETLCEKIKHDARIKSCTPSYMAVGQSIKAAPIQPHINTKSIPYLDQIMVGVTPETEPKQGKLVPSAFVSQLSELSGVQLKATHNQDGIHVLQLPKKRYEAEAEALCEKIKQDARIKWCEPNYMAVGQSAAAPTDTYYVSGVQWNLGNEAPAGINAKAAWAMTPGSSSTVIAIIDGGIIPHTDITAGRLLPGYDFISDPTRAADGNGRDADPTDPGDWSVADGCPKSSWHGTAVTGVIGATTDNNFGIAGINQAARLLPVRVLGKCKKGTQLDIIAAIQWAAGIAVSGVPNNPNPAKVLNLSLSISTPCSTSLQTAIDAVRKKGVVVVAGAGNDDGVDTSQVSPASCIGVLTVGSVTRFGGKGTTTTGTRIDIAAPGAAASSSHVDTVPTTSDSGTQTRVGDNVINGYYGTSFAAPHVTGIVSLMQGVRPRLRPAHVTDLIRKTARPFPSNTGSDCDPSICGVGLLDGEAVVAAAKSRIKGGLYHTVASKADGTVWAWGYNGNGQLGGGTVGAVVTAPVKLAGLADAVGASAGGYHSLTTQRDGTVRAWGYNGNGRLGDGTTTEKNAPVLVSGLTNVIEVVAGDAHNLALKADGTVWAWGYNFFGQLGAGSFDYTDRTIPVQVPGLTNVVAIAAGGKGSMALKNDGTVWVWGSYKLNMKGAIPISDADWNATGGASGPYPVPGLTNVVTISAGGDSATGVNADVCLALTADEQLYAWGSNDWGELGQGTAGSSTSKSLPTLVSALAGKTILNMATSGYHVVALTNDSQQWAWGLGSSGQLGNGMSGTLPGQTVLYHSKVPIASATGLLNVLDLTVGVGHTVALNADLTYSSWGGNNGGQLGNDSTTLKSNPVTILGTGGAGVYTANKANTVKTDVQVTMSSAPNPVVVGQNITYTVGISNVGTAAASNVRATVILPAEASFVSADAGCVYNANVGAVTCTITSLNASTSVTRVVVAKIAAAGSYAAVASTVFDGTDSLASNNVAGTQLTVSSASSDGDVPLPAWALVLLGAGLLKTLRGHQFRASI